MGALLKFLLIGLLGLWLWYSPAVRKLWGGSAEGTTGRARKRTSAEALQPEAMVRCAQCGIHLPRSEALLSADGRTFCCAAHRDQARDQAGHG